jgi:cobalamin biosynthesis Mg chelatase CobN
MNNLPKEFYEWLRKLKHPHIVYLRERKEWFDMLPETCRTALVVEWLEVEGDFVVSAQYSGEDDSFATCIEKRTEVLPVIIDFKHGKTRNEALIAGIEKALEI